MFWPLHETLGIYFVVIQVVLLNSVIGGCRLWELDGGNLVIKNISH